MGREIIEKFSLLKRTNPPHLSLGQKLHEDILTILKGGQGRKEKKRKRKREFDRKNDG